MALRIVVSISIALLYTQSAFAEDSVTRYGTLSVSDDSVLLFKGKPVKPEIRGNNGLELVEKYSIGDADIVLVQNNGGNACPALLRLVSVSGNGISVTKEFGSCSDLVKHERIGNEIVITTPKMQGKGDEVYVYKNSKLLKKR